MPYIPLKAIAYEDFDPKNPREFIDKIVENFNMLSYLLNNSVLDKININPAEIEGIPEPEWEEPWNPPVDQYGFDPTFLKFHSNKVSNSSFERIGLDGNPLYWDTSQGGTVTPDSNFDGDMTLKLDPGDKVIQKEEGSSGFFNTTWWAWCGGTGHTRISFRAKGTLGGSNLLKVRVLNMDNVAQPLTFWTYDHDEGWALNEGVTEIIYECHPLWPLSLRTFAVHPTEAGKLKIQFENVGDIAIYLDALTAEPDWSKRWPSVYTDGANSVRKIFVQDTEPTGACSGDVWLQPVE